MIYEIDFLIVAKKDWDRLDPAIRSQFKKKLEKLCHHPRVPGSKLRGHPDRYKIKLRSAGFRLVYEVHDTELVILVIGVGKREGEAVYRATALRSADPDDE